MKRTKDRLLIRLTASDFIADRRNPEAERGYQAQREYRRLQSQLTGIRNQLAETLTLQAPLPDMCQSLIDTLQDMLNTLEQHRYAIPLAVCEWHISTRAKQTLLAMGYVRVQDVLAALPVTRFGKPQTHREIVNYLRKHRVLDSRTWIDSIAA